MIRTLLLGLFFTLAIILALPWLILWSVIVGNADLMYGLAMKVVRLGNRIAGIRVRIEGLENLDKIIDIDQSPIGRTPRSNPITSPTRTRSRLYRRFPGAWRF